MLLNGRTIATITGTSTAITTLYYGRVFPPVKTTGDGLLAEFGSSVGLGETQRLLLTHPSWVIRFHV